MGTAMRAGLAVLSVLVSLCAERARARADEDPESPIPIHPGVVTVLQFPDAIVHTWLDHHGEIQVARIRDKLYIRPRPGTPAGMEAWLEVETRTLHQTFRLLVVARARDAREDVWIVPVEVQSREESPGEMPAELATPLALPAGPVAPPPAVTPEAAAPAASAPTSVTIPAPPELIIAPGPTESITDPVPTTMRAARTEISVHAIGALGFTSLDVMGSAPIFARQPHLSLGARLAVTRPDSWWSLEATINGEWPVGPMVFVEENATSPVLMLKGPWVRADMGMRVWVGTKWRPSVYAGLGVQLHLRRTETESTSRLPAFSETMPRDVVLVLGIGLQRRAGSLLLGLDFQVREGGLDGYHSAAVLWTMGCYLDPD